MRFLIPAIFALLLFPGCNKKSREAAQTDALTSLIVNGQRVVTSYTKGTANLTADFSAFSFQFRDNGTVDAVKNGVVEKTGSWAGNISTRTIVSSFSNTNATLLLLNGTWTVTDSGLTYVESSQTIAGEERRLRLDKL